MLAERGTERQNRPSLEVQIHEVALQDQGADIGIEDRKGTAPGKEVREEELGSCLSFSCPGRIRSSYRVLPRKLWRKSTAQALEVA